MKLLVFAHTPPPHHGQSYMVQLMLEGFGGDHASPNLPSPISDLLSPPIHCYHVNAKMSDDMEDIGGIRPGKILRLLKHCLQAIRYRFQYGVDTLYYVPAPAKKSAIVRDWIVMLLVRPFFKRTIPPTLIFGYRKSGLQFPHPTSHLPNSNIPLRGQFLVGSEDAAAPSVPPRHSPM